LIKETSSSAWKSAENASIPFGEHICWCLHPSILNPLHNILGTHQVWHTSSCETIYNYFWKHGFFS
jgi:hypothetical protein